jgi:hypothetical protein
MSSLLRLAAIDPPALKAGGLDVVRVMLGDQQVWPAVVSAEPFAFLTGQSGYTYSNADRTITKSSSSSVSVLAGAARSTGKWYAEFVVDVYPWGISFGLADSVDATALIGSYAVSCRMAEWGSFAQTGFAGATTDTGRVNIGGLDVNKRMCLAVDFDAKQAWFSVDGAWLSSADPEAGIGPTLYGWSSGSLALRPGVRLPADTSRVTIPGSFLHTPAGFSAWGSLS